MGAFATAADLEARWRTLTLEEQARAETLLVDVAAFITGALVRSGIALDPLDDTQVTNLKSVSCSVVRRAMDVPDGRAGVSQYSETAGPFTGSASFANPNADLYMTKSERARLGLGRQRAGSIRPVIGGADDTW